MDTDPEAFIRWALDDARTLEERYATELLVERAESQWHIRHKTGHFTPYEKTLARQRERYLNPAYQPHYSEQSLRRAAEILPTVREWELVGRYQERALRDAAVLRFLPSVEKLSVTGDLADLSVFAELPNLRDLGFSSPVCEDFRPLARCVNLRRLSLHLGVHWPEVAGLEALQLLEELSLGGNLLVFPPGLTFPRVREGSLSCTPLHARSVRDLPQLPACEFLTLAGVERLDGIEALPRLRNLTLQSAVRDFTPLTALTALTCFHCTSALPLDVAPLARVPALLSASFQTQHRWGSEKAPPRDYAPLAASTTLRQVSVSGCAPVELEVAALNTAFTPWDDLFLLPQPRPVPPLRVIIAPVEKHPKWSAAPPAREGAPLEDKGLRAREAEWITRHVTRLVNERIGHTDWGKAEARSYSRTLSVTVECYEVLERFPEIIEALRQALAQLRAEHIGSLYILLRVPPPKPTPAQAELLKRFRREDDEAAAAQRRRDEQERLERLHLLQIKQQQGEPINPAEFSPTPPEPPPPDPWEVENNDDDEHEEGSGIFAIKEKSEPLPDFWNDEHPLADNYNCSLDFTLGEVWLDPHYAALGLHLLQREADEVIPEDPPAAP